MMQTPMRVLIGCEESGMVRRAFAARGHDAWSCDLKPSRDGSNRHIRGDVRDYLNDGWDLLCVFHPPCTRLCNSGVRWLVGKDGGPPKKLPKGRTLESLWAELEDGADLFSACWNAPVDRVAVENPVMHRYAKERIRNYEPATQTVQPHWFGDPAFKATGLYLRGLPPLEKTNPLTIPAPGTDEHKVWSVILRMSPGPDRGEKRSETFPGIAEAMADQWGGYATADSGKATA